MGTGKWQVGEDPVIAGEIQHRARLARRNPWVLVFQVSKLLIRVSLRFFAVAFADPTMKNIFQVIGPMSP